MKDQETSNGQALKEEELDKVTGGTTIQGKGSNSGQGHDFAE